MTIDLRVYLITDRKMLPEGKLLESVEGALRGGVRAVQLREKDLSIREMSEYAFQMREITNEYNAQLYINDRVDVAMSVRADGVHLGNASMPVCAVRKIAGKEFHIGVSTHGYDEASRAERDGADFITFGPVYETPSKVQYGRPVGLRALKSVVKEITIPIYALGGITISNIPEVKATGVQGISMISSIFGADDIENQTKKIVRLMQ